MIYIKEQKNGKTELRAIDHRAVDQVVMRGKLINGLNKRRWDLVLTNGTIFELKDDDEYLVAKSAPEFNRLLEDMAKIFRV